jgi:hypothetical protein
MFVKEENNEQELFPNSLLINTICVTNSFSFFPCDAEENFRKTSNVECGGKEGSKKRGKKVEQLFLRILLIFLS